MSILDDLLSGDPMRIWSASGSVRHLRDQLELLELASHIDKIRNATKGVNLGGALRPNSSHLNFALQKLEYVRDSKGCLCKLYTLDEMYNPKREEASGYIRIVETKYLEGKWVDYYSCECVYCGVKFQVEEREYHYTWWAWKEV